MNDITKISNLQALADYQKHLLENPRLKFLFFELTDKCNLNCVHCGSNSSAQNSHFLPFDTVQTVLEQVAGAYDPQQIMVCITGGEPVLHPDVVRVVRMAHDAGFAVGITTNATLIDERMACDLVAAGLDTVAVSLDGVGQAHDVFRGRAGSFQAAADGIFALRNAGIESQVVTVVSKMNLDKLDEIYDFLRGLDVYSWKLTNVDPIGRAGEAGNKGNLLLSGAEMRELFEYIKRKRESLQVGYVKQRCEPLASDHASRKRKKMQAENTNQKREASSDEYFRRKSEDSSHEHAQRECERSAGNMEVTYGCSHFLTVEFEHEVRDFYFQCIAGTQVASVDASGNIRACLDIENAPELVQGHVPENNFVDVWENRFQQFRRDRSVASNFCKGCAHSEICMGDSAHTWDFKNKQPKYCVAKWQGA